MPTIKTEAQLQARIVAEAKVNGWLAYHTFDSRKSEPGFPDLVLVKGDLVWFLELKTERGKVSKAQAAWLRALELVAEVRAEVLRPRDLDYILEELNDDDDI